MSFDRREMLRLGAAGAAGLMLSSAAGSQVLPGLLMPQQPFGPASPPMARVPAQPQALTAPGGIDPQLFARAKAALDQHRIYARDTMGIVDFSKPSAEPRFHLVDLRSGEVESHRVCHGRRQHGCIHGR